jgi:hypothetical protein
MRIEDYALIGDLHYVTAVFGLVHRGSGKTWAGG